jgi:hypothetical protein
VDRSHRAYDHGDEYSGSIKGGEFAAYLSDYQLFRDSV